ncbi:DUF6683 family protein [Pseudorhodoferax sp.]|uniref:DUF6683 family protein n=1 Tax=Pseudorhodoferax sp. TaxID=1993553 RepID=UPI0039E681E2
MIIVRQCICWRGAGGPSRAVAEADLAVSPILGGGGVGLLLPDGRIGESSPLGERMNHLPRCFPRLRISWRDAVHALLAALLTTALSTAQADPPIFVPSDDLATGLMQGVLARRMLQKGQKKRQEAGNAAFVEGGMDHRARTMTVVPVRATPRAPQKLAQHYPPQRRVEAVRTFRQLLDGYHQVEARMGVPRGDLAGALAAFIAGNLMAYHDRDVPDAYFPAVVEQLRPAVVGQPGFARIGTAEKQDAYEQLAILGTFMALTRQALRRQPDAQIQARMREAARGYLAQLGVDAARTEMTAQGVVQR